MRWIGIGTVSIGVGILLASACSSDDPNDATDNTDAVQSDEVSSEVATWYRDVKPIVDRRCVSCHISGGAAPFPLDSYEAAQPFVAAMGAAIEAGRMPPWSPDPTCREYADQRVLDPAERATLLEWVAADGPEGDVETATPSAPPEIVALSGTVLVAKPKGPYTPNDESPDDYRCFLLDREFPDEVWVRAIQVIPGAGAAVHHVLIYVVSPAELSDIEASDAADTGEGYTCFGGTGAKVPNPVGGWVPGSRPARLSDDTATVIPAGSRLVMQVHYNLSGVAAEPDLTEFHMEVTDDRPVFRFASRPLAHLGLDITAGDPVSVQQTSFVNHRSAPLNVIQVNGHMHLLGTSISLELVPQGSEADECLLDIPKWDFNWQQQYPFLPGVVATANPGDAFKLTCQYDNSAANQPIINGETVESTDVEWGDGTRDEMCVAYIGVIEPFVPVAERIATCGSFAGCRAECTDPNSLDCLWRCGGDDDACTQCMLGKAANCASSVCLTELIAAEDCIIHCAVVGGDVAACTSAYCPNEYSALKACAAAPLATGTCEDSYTECGVVTASR
jgi:mono/diheme cytochrome c family protein